MVDLAGVHVVFEVWVSGADAESVSRNRARGDGGVGAVQLDGHSDVAAAGGAGVSGGDLQNSGICGIHIHAYGKALKKEREDKKKERMNEKVEVFQVYFG